MIYRVQLTIVHRTLVVIIVFQLILLLMIKRWVLIIICIKIEIILINYYFLFFFVNNHSIKNLLIVLYNYRYSIRITADMNIFSQSMRNYLLKIYYMHCRFSYPSFKTWILPNFLLLLLLLGFLQIFHFLEHQI